MKEPSLYPEVGRALRAVFPKRHIIKVPGSTFNQGIPDFVLTDNVIEVKVARKGRGKVAPTALQQSHLDEVSRRGGLGACLVYDEVSSTWCFFPNGAAGFINVERHKLVDALGDLYNER